MTCIFNASTIATAMAMLAHFVEPVEGVIYPLYKRDKDEYAEQNSGKSLEFKPGKLP